MGGAVLLRPRVWLRSSKVTSAAPVRARPHGPRDAGSHGLVLVYRGCCVQCREKCKSRMVVGIGSLEGAQLLLMALAQRQITPGEIPGSRSFLRGRWRLPRRASVRLLTPRELDQ